MASFRDSTVGALELGAGSGASRGLSPRAPPGKPSGDRTALDQLSEWQDISLSLADALRRHEATDCLIFRKLFDGSHDEAGKVACELGCGSEVVDELVMLWEASRFAAQIRLQLMSHFSTFFASVSRVKEERASKRSRLQLQSQGKVSSAAASCATAQLPMRKWPTRLRKLLARASGPEARAGAEQQERERWLRKLREHLVHAQLPLAKMALAKQHPESAWEGIGHGLRARTLRRRVKDWERAARYFQVAFGRSWPADVGMVLDHIQTMRESGAAHSPIQSSCFCIGLDGACGWGGEA